MVAPLGGGGGGSAGTLWLAEAVARRAYELRALLALHAPWAPYAPLAPPSPTDVVALAGATREGLSRVKARCSNSDSLPQLGGQG